MSASADSRSTGKGNFYLWSGVVLALVVGFWVHDPSSFISDDSFFYLETARRLALTGVQTFSGIYPTNGVHPLWIYLLSGYGLASSLVFPDLSSLEYLALPLSAGLLLGGALFFGRSARLMGLDPVLVVIPQLCFLGIMGVLYSEAHANYFALGLLTMLAAGGVQRRRWGHLWLGLAAGLVFLGRLDTVFFLMWFYLWYLYDDRRLGRVIVSGLVLSLVACIYMGSNVVFFGGATPISGWLKSSFPHPIFQGVKYLGGLNLSVANYNFFFGIVPVVFALIVAAIWRKEIKGPFTLIYPYLGGALTHFVYCGFFTIGFATWYWYYVNNVVAGSLAFAFLVSRLPRQVLARNLAAGAMCLGVVAYLFAVKLDARFHPRQTMAIDFLKEHDVENQTVLVSEWPGAVAYFSKDNIVAADMLTGNQNLYRDMIASGNALEYLDALAASKDRPIQWIIYNGGRWATPTSDRQQFVLNDPKQWPRKVAIGALEVGDPFYVREDPLFIVWKLDSDPPSARAGSAVDPVP